MMQCRWGSHGDYEIISLVPSSVQETFDLTIEAFNLSEQYRVPTFVMIDGILGHMYERLTIPEPKDIKLVYRRKPKKQSENYLPFEAENDLVPPMATFGEGYHFYSTGLTHDEMGYPDMSIEIQDKLIRRLSDKIRLNEDKITKVEKIDVEDAEILVIAYGLPSRSAQKAVESARNEDIKVGLLRLITVWPFPNKILEDLSSQLKDVIMLEMNYGQLVREVQ